MDIEKMQKSLKVMEINFLETMHWNSLKLLEHVTIIHMHLPVKHLGQWMHGCQVMEKTNLCSMYFFI